MISIRSGPAERGSQFETGKMKLYFIVGLITVATHMGSAFDVVPYEYECPLTGRIIPCNHHDPSHCAIYCTVFSSNKGKGFQFGYFCYNTHPPMFCSSVDAEYCRRYCQGAARATSLPIAGQKIPDANV